MKTFRYRIYPRKEEERILEEWFDECLKLWNYLLEDRKRRWEEEKKGTSFYDQCKLITKLRREGKIRKDIPVVVLRGVAKRVDTAFKSFFQGIKGKRKVGYPKGKEVCQSLEYIDKVGFKLEGEKLILRNVGEIEVRMHRPLEGKVKGLRIKKEATGKWFCNFVVECEEKEGKEGVKAVGIDMGIREFCVLSTGERIENPKFYDELEEKLKKAQRRLSKKEEGTEVWHKVRRRIARIHEKIKNKRKDFLHKLSKRIVDEYDIIVVEDLGIQGIVQDSRFMAKRIYDASWGEFIKMLEYKAKAMGKRLVKVEAKGTTRRCSGCGAENDVSLKEDIYCCSNCGLELDRKLNSAINILRLGLQSLGDEP